MLNGQPLLIRGANRREHHPQNGQVMDEETMVQDIVLMKQNNFNAVRCSHYPNHPLWYTLCDRYGLYVVDEANIETHGMVPMNRLSDDPTATGDEPARDAHGAARPQPSEHYYLVTGQRIRARRKSRRSLPLAEIRRPVPPGAVRRRRADTAATDIICPMYARVDGDQPFPAVPKWSIKNGCRCPASSAR